MKNIIFSLKARKILLATLKTRIKNMSAKQYGYTFFILLVLSFYFLNHLPFGKSHSIRKETQQLAMLNEQLADVKEKDSLVGLKQKGLLINEIEDKLTNFLYDAPDYNHLNVLKEYLKYSPRLLNDIPSCMPLVKGNYTLNSKFGMRFHPIAKKQKKHTGVDLASSKGTHVFSTASGIVIKTVQGSTGYGNYIVIKHRFGFETLYGHLSTILVRKGEKVQENTLIGTVGSTGASTGNHLHYEIKKNGIKINPILSFNLKKSVFLNQIE